MKFEFQLRPDAIRLCESVVCASRRHCGMLTKITITGRSNLSNCYLSPTAEAQDTASEVPTRRTSRNSSAKSQNPKVSPFSVSEESGDQRQERRQGMAA